VSRDLDRRILAVSLSLVAAAAACSPATSPTLPAASGGSNGSSPAASVAGGPSAGASSTTTGGGNGTLTVGSVTVVQQLDIQQAGEFEGLQQIYPMYDALTNIAPDGTLLPGLATSWSFSADAKELTLKLRTDVKFHDGTPFDANAVQFNLDRELLKSNQYNAMGTFGLPPAWLGLYDHSQVVDPATIVVSFKQPDPVAIWNMSAVPGFMESPAAIEKYGKDYPSHPTGTGAFQFVSQDSNGLVLQRNDSYWGTKPSISKLVFTPIPDDQARTAALQSGRVDAIYEPASSTIPQLQSGFTSIKEPLDHVANVGLDTSTKPFDSALVRQAFSYAIDRQTLCTQILAGICNPTVGPFPPTLFGADSSKTGGPYQYDPNMAKQLLTQAGYPNGLDFNWLVPLSGVASPEPVNWATFLQSNLAAVGMNAHITKLEANATLNQEFKGLKGSPYQAATIGWTILTADPDSWLSQSMITGAIPPNGLNYGYYSNSQFDQAVKTGASVADDAQRKSAYSDAQAVMLQEVPWVEVFHWVFWVSTKPTVNGIVVLPNGVVHFEGATIQ
jgi:peptide/nickel transport system substrate-binding protein